MSVEIDHVRETNGALIESVDVSATDSDIGFGLTFDGRDFLMGTYTVDSVDSDVTQVRWNQDGSRLVNTIKVSFSGGSSDQFGLAWNGRDAFTVGYSVKSIARFRPTGEFEDVSTGQKMKFITFDGRDFLIYEDAGFTVLLYRLNDKGAIQISTQITIGSEIFGLCWNGRDIGVLLASGEGQYTINVYRPTGELHTQHVITRTYTTLNDLASNGRDWFVLVTI